MVNLELMKKLAILVIILTALLVGLNEFYVKFDLQTLLWIIVVMIASTFILKLSLCEDTTPDI